MFIAYWCLEDDRDKGLKFGYWNEWMSDLKERCEIGKTRHWECGCCESCSTQMSWAPNHGKPMQWTIFCDFEGDTINFILFKIYIYIYVYKVDKLSMNH